MIVAGMGGSAIGGALARAALGDRVSRPLGSARGYELPSWATPDAVVVCASYSGNTEETLACYEAAGALGATRVVVTSGGELADLARADGVPVIPVPGGFQPRAAVAYMTVAALEIAQLHGVAPCVHSELDVAAAHAEQLVEQWGPDSPEDSLPKQLAFGLADAVPIIVGAGPTAAVAYRWATQLNENAKVPAFAGELPEFDHNAIEGWDDGDVPAGFATVFLDDSDLHPRLRQRIALTRELTGERVASSQVVEATGDSATERVISLVLLGDLVSIYLAALRGQDPTPVGLIERLKTELAAGEPEPVG
jgi:glucose/mannose-6-phosphate isomerase